MSSMCNARRIVTLAVLAFGASCRQDMHQQPRVDPYEQSLQDPSLSSARMPPDGVVARGDFADDVFLPSATEPNAFPLEVTNAVMQRGRERFDIFCVPCHGLIGRGDGPVSQRGFFPRVANLQEDRLRTAPANHFYDVMTNGFGLMPSYAAVITPADRWAVIAYVRALQLSQHAAESDLSTSDLSAPGGEP